LAHRALIFALVLFVTALIGCPAGPVESEDPPPQPAPFYEPDAPGPYWAGTQQFGLLSREGVVLDLQVWHPAPGPGDDEYLYGGYAAGGATTPTAVSCDTPRPVLMFSHGNSGISYQTWSVMEFFASHGWLVAAPDHALNTLFDNQSDRWLEIALRRPWDIADSFDWLVSESDRETSSLHGCVDADAGYAVMGHSFGGFTTNAVAGASYDVAALAERCINNPEPACALVEELATEEPMGTLNHSDPRAWAAVTWAPAWHDKLGPLSDINVPILVIGADRDATTPWDAVVEPSYRELTATPRALAELTDAGHFSFTDFCTVVNANDGCSDAFRPFRDVLETTRTAALAFLQTVQGQEQASDWLPPELGVSSWENAE
jgi:predicted dienelactone hydrolase